MKSNKGLKLTAPELTIQTLKLFQSNPEKKFGARQILNKLNVSNNKDSMIHVLTTLEKKSLIEKHKEDQYKLIPVEIKTSTKKPVTTGPKKIYTGRVDMTKTGAGYIIIDNLEYDMYVPEKYMNNAMDKDIVKVESNGKLRGKMEGRVVEIVKRSITSVVGELRLFKNYAIVIPLPATRFPDVLIKAADINRAKDGEKVIAEIIDWGSTRSQTIWGRVTHILKEADANEIAMQSIIIESGFPFDFAPDALKEADKINGAITEKDIKERRDFREVLTFTIDPKTAKDFDDAISYKELEKGHFEIGVHIADVSHYLKENTALDKEAYYRSTSVYLVDRVLPMLPEKLSNDLCSLNPNEDKLTFSAVFIFDSKYKIIDEWFGRTIIHSSRRFTYEEAQERLESGEGDLAIPLQKINEIAYKLRKDKFKNGAINFDSEEVTFELDQDKKPIAIQVKERKDSHMLIEDFMLLANKSVAKYIAKKVVPEIPFVYRIHDMPDAGKLTDFALFAHGLGFSMKIDTPRHIAESFNSLMKEAEENEALKVLAPLGIRTMAKAEYSTKNIGHYGLAFEYYTHFTSPIRRYSDVLVHRLLWENLDKKIQRVDKDLLEQKCKHISRQEIKATEAERASIKYKQVEWMKNFEGQVFEARVSGIIEKGIFVEQISSKAEGLIPFSTMAAKYSPSPDKLSAISKKAPPIKMGDRLMVRLMFADITNRRLEFEMVEE